jgi:dTDP-3-amino-2,3,6-trideoxy-4-keto-D-glucose/dTDP-3-amino-3,4,6-trideoxy-alpha-D-glucose/dTDP-2,6-dideoxy-D-kanosamine transaminase
LTITVWDYRQEYAELRDEVLGAVDAVFKSGKLILGQQVGDFEAAFAKYCGCGSGIGVNSGTDALFIALKILGVGDGDEVITVTNTAIPTVSAIVSAGGVPRFVDIEPTSYLMDVGKIEAAITSRTKVILPVHLYGQCVDMDPVMEIAARHGLKVLEDCAQSTGALYKGRMCGSIGHAAAFSFYPTKILGGYGDGGMVTTSDSELAAHARSLRMYGTKGTYYAEEHGYNSRLDEVQAAILAVKLKSLDRWIDRRREIAQAYDQHLPSQLVRPVQVAGNRHAYYLYVARHPDRDRILAKLRENDIIVNISYPWPISTMRGYQNLGYGEGDLPHSESAAREIFSLPMYPHLADEQVARVCETLHDIIGKQ